MKTKCKLIGFFAFVAVITFLIVACRGGDRRSYDPESDFEARPVDGGRGVVITQYVGSKWEVSIPPQIQNLPVIAIGNGAFREKNLISVIIPNSVITIGDDAFANNQLTSITIPNSVKAIGDRAYNLNQITSITIGANVDMGVFWAQQMQGAVRRVNESFGDGFPNFYYYNDEEAGTYTFSNGSWSISASSTRDRTPRAVDAFDGIPIAEDALDAETSYAFGMWTISIMNANGHVGLSYDYNAFVRGFKDFNEPWGTRLTIGQADELIRAFSTIAGTPRAEDALDANTSYAFGMLMANQVMMKVQVSLSYDYYAFLRGFRDFNEAQETRLTPDRAMELINSAVMRLQAQGDERMWLEGEQNCEEGEAYTAQNRAKGGVNTTASGLQYEVISQGSGRRPGPDDVVRVHYEGTLINGIVFDSSYSRGAPAEFPLNAVITGWTEGLQLMNEGSTYRFVIPSDLAYGPNGAGSIPPGATLIFKVELLSIVR